MPPAQENLELFFYAPYLINVTPNFDSTLFRAEPDSQSMVDEALNPPTPYQIIGFPLFWTPCFLSIAHVTGRSKAIYR